MKDSERILKHINNIAAELGCLAEAMASIFRRLDQLEKMPPCQCGKDGHKHGGQ